MELWTTKGLTMMHRPLQIILTFLFFISFPSLTAAIEERQVAINMDQTTFEESIVKLSQVFDMEITLVGVSGLPQHKFSFAVEKATFEQATKEAMRKADLQNRVLIWDHQTKTARIWILPAGKAYAINSLAKYKNDMKTMTPKIFNNLETAESENLRMMTKEEYARLEPESTGNYRGMTPEEFAALKPTESENFRMMTREEYDRLEPDSGENLRGMTPEEFAQLQQDE